MATYNETMSGGVTLGGSATSTATYSTTAAGGVTLGGAATETYKPVLAASFSTTVTLASSTPGQPIAQTGAAFASSFTLGDLFVTLNSGDDVSFSSRFDVSGTTDLASGRYRR